MELHDIIIKPEFRDFLPSLKDRTALAEKIAAEGWTDEPITVWQHHNILLDGHNRYAIWQERIKNGIDDDGPLIRELKFDSEEAAFYWVVNNQCARRNLTPEEQRYLLGRKYTAEKSVKGAPVGNENAKKQIHQSGAFVSGSPENNTTARRIALENSVGKTTVERAERFANAVDDLDKRGIVAKSEVLSGKVKAPATRIVAASKAATEEEAKEILKPTKPKAVKEDAPTQEPPKREAGQMDEGLKLTPKEERKRLLAFAKVEKAWTTMKEIPNDDKALQREAFEELIHRLKCIIKKG